MKQKTTFKQQVITIYLQLFMAVGVIMMIIGGYRVAKNVYQRALFDQYPMGYDETRCDYIGYDRPMPVDTDAVAYDESEAKDRQQQCLDRLEKDRAIRKASDLFDGMILLVLGGAVFAGHVVVWRRQ